MRLRPHSGPLLHSQIPGEMGSVRGRVNGRSFPGEACCEPRGMWVRWGEMRRDQVGTDVWQEMNGDVFRRAID